MTENFKSRYANHKKSFNHKSYVNETELSSYYHTFENSEDIKVKFEILRTCPGKPKYGFCSLCLAEKLEIFNNKDNNLLNSKLQLVSFCTHQKKMLLNDTNLVYSRHSHLISDK